MDHLYQGAASAPTARAARGSIAEAPDHACDILSIAVLADHYDDVAVAKEVRCQKNSSMPESIDDSLVRLPDCAVVLPAIHFPAQGAAQNPDTPVTQPGDEPGFEPFSQNRHVDCGLRIAD